MEFPLAARELGRQAVRWRTYGLRMVLGVFAFFAVGIFWLFGGGRSVADAEELGVALTWLGSAVQFASAVLLPPLLTAPHRENTDS